MTCKWDDVFHHWLGLQEASSADGGQADWDGIGQYLTYSVNRCTNRGMRLEWFRDEEGTPVGLNRSSNPNSAR
ncbi:outer membrane beta-barrel protein [Stieleria bergensis]|uniref:outer membrane beta-barrel protein n=1 Tax=Stieleria bergensis TaxID=2528025 RepID=UPI003AF39BDA